MSAVEACQLPESVNGITRFIVPESNKWPYCFIIFTIFMLSLSLFIFVYIMGSDALFFVIFESIFGALIVGIMVIKIGETAVVFDENRGTVAIEYVRCCWSCRCRQSMQYNAFKHCKVTRYRYISQMKRGTCYAEFVFNDGSRTSLHLAETAYFPRQFVEDINNWWQENGPHDEYDEQHHETLQLTTFEDQEEGM